MTAPRKKIALWFRYGPAEHAELFHALPELVRELAGRCDVYYFGMRGRREAPEAIARHARVTYAPFSVDRTSHRDKMRKTALWVLYLPLVALRCRRLGIDAVYIDETIPLTAWIARIFYGPRVAITVADFFVDIYLAGSAPARWLARLLRSADLASWRRLPLIFTRARYTRGYLARHGVPPERVVPVYDPCDMAVYRPVDRSRARARFGFADGDVVLVHHGILHPNKGNDRILRWLAPLAASRPGLRYLLVGDGPQMAPLKALCAELGLERTVVFTGWLPSLEDVNEALNAGDIGLVMRIGDEADNFHMTGALVHSMACGLPILGARLGGVSEVVEEGVSGFLFPPDDGEAFRAGLLALAADPELRARMGRAALAEARESFDMRSVIVQTAGPLFALAGAQEDSP
jgi:glycosyltransferase involved in cell wall biosynthesis